MQQRCLQNGRSGIVAVGEAVIRQQTDILRNDRIAHLSAGIADQIADIRELSPAVIRERLRAVEQHIAGAVNDLAVGCGAGFRHIERRLRDEPVREIDQADEERRQQKRRPFSGSAHTWHSRGIQNRFILLLHLTRPLSFSERDPSGQAPVPP